MVNIIAASTSAGNIICGISDRSKPPPREKKNRIKKKSRNGLRLSAIYCAMGLVAIEMPAIKAPISRDRPMLSANSATPKHQPIANRKIYSPIRSKRENSGCNTKRTISTEPPISTGSAIKLRPNCSMPELPEISDISISRTKMAKKSCISSMPTISSPECRWCRAVVGSNLMPIMVLENIIEIPIIRHSIKL